MTAIITNQLFGRGRTWNGKLIQDDSIGINRFLKTTSSADTGVPNIIETQHQFDHTIGESQLDSKSPSLKLNYSPYQKFTLSPWRGMHDELRWIKCASGRVMIGIGYFDWSGGVLNSSPFVLYMPSSANQEEVVVEVVVEVIE